MDRRAIEDEEHRSEASTATQTGLATGFLGTKAIWQRFKGDLPHRPSGVVRDEELPFLTAHRRTDDELAVPRNLRDSSIRHASAERGLVL